jgi:hypothetical protein
LRVEGDEPFNLLNHSAQDIGRYDFLKDVQRLEQIVSGQENIVGYAIMLTNDNSYWSAAKSDLTVDANFRIHDGRVITGVLSWGRKASAGTMKSREQPIDIRGQYTMKWRDYSAPGSGAYGIFKYLIVRIVR